MTTDLFDFSNEQDALVIILNDQPEKNGIEEYANLLFPVEQFLYLENEELSGTGMVDFLRNRIREQYVALPKGNRMLFCWYLPLTSLTREWIDRFFEVAEAVQRFIPPVNMFDQHYMLCFNYETGSVPGKEWNRVLPLLQKLASERKSEISHHIYMLRSVGVETFESQEKGIIQLAHLLSRKDYYKVDTPGDMYTGYLKMVIYADYYENRVAHCQERLEYLHQWLEGENDPQFTRLLNLMRYQHQGSINELKRAASGFKRRKGLFPASIEDFKGNPITGYKSAISDNDERIVRRQHEYLEDISRQLVDGVDLSEASQLIQDEYTYKDSVNLREALQNGAFSKMLADGLDRKGVENDIGLFVRGVSAIYKKQAEDWFASLEKQKQEYEEKQRYYKKELNKAGTYESLEACLRHIDEDTKPPILNGRFAEHTDTIALISGNSLEKWRSRMLSIKNVPRAYRYSRKDEDLCEIALLKESDITDLTNEDAVASLERLFGGE